MSNIRVPVLSPSNIPLMPTKASRARRWIKEGKAIIVKNDLGLFQIKLVTEPSAYNRQDIAVGIDPGSCFTGIAVQSKQETLVGLNLNLPGREISRRIAERAILRRTRRGRRIKRSLPFNLRNHRQIRFNNRKKSKLPPSILANKQLELRIIRELLKIYPISHAYIERITNSSNKGFTRACQGQNYLISELVDLLQVNLVKGFETSNTRQYLRLPKSKNKGEQTPSAHVNDGISLAARNYIKYEVHNLTNSGLWVGEVKITEFNFLVVSRLGNRPRKLHQLTISKGGTRKSYGGFMSTHSYRNGDIVEYKTKNGIHLIVSPFDRGRISMPKKVEIKTERDGCGALLAFKL